MPASWKGLARGPIRVTKQQIVSPDGGLQIEEVWTGDEVGINSVLRNARRVNKEIRSGVAPKGGGVWTARLSYPVRDAIDGRPAEVIWECNTELYSRDAFDHPTVDTEAELWATSEAGESKASYRKKIEDAVRKGEALPAKFSSYPIAEQVKTALRQGSKSWEDDTSVLSRTRKAGINYSFNREIYEAKTIYSTAQIGLPEDFQMLFSDAEIASRAAVKYTAWGWRLRGQEFSTKGNTGIETISWVLGAWSLVAYKLATGSYPDKT